MLSCKYKRRQLRLAPLILALLCLAGCDKPPESIATSSPGQNQPPVADTGTGTDYEQLKQQLDKRLTALQKQLTATASSRATAPAKSLFQGWLYHARLTGQPASYSRAREALDELQRRSRGIPPCREEITWLLATHQPGKAADSLNECQAPETRDLAIDIAYYLGDYRKAITLAVDAATASNSPDSLVRLARLRMSTGSPQEAATLLEAAEKRYHNDNAHQLAWFKLQRGLIALHRGDFQRARALFKRSTEALPGWWLSQEHLAEASLLLGDTATARELYNDVIGNTGAGAFLAARAAIDQQEGHEQAAREGLQRARADLEQRLAEAPEAMAGHVVEFFLEHGPPEQALELAQQDYARRPFGEAATLLARVLLQQGDARAAIALLTPHLEAGWDTADAHSVLARAHSAEGEQSASNLHRRRALLLNPVIFND